jgi:hypothetical protein
MNPKARVCVPIVIILPAIASFLEEGYSSRHPHGDIPVPSTTHMLVHMRGAGYETR